LELVAHIHVLEGVACFPACRWSQHTRQGGCSKMPCPYWIPRPPSTWKRTIKIRGWWVVGHYCAQHSEVTYSGMETLIAGVFLLSSPVTLTAVAE